VFEIVGVLKLLPFAMVDGRGGCNGVAGAVELRFLGGNPLVLIALFLPPGGGM